MPIKIMRIRIAVVSEIALAIPAKAAIAKPKIIACNTQKNRPRIIECMEVRFLFMLNLT